MFSQTFIGFDVMKQTKNYNNHLYNKAKKKTGRGDNSNNLLDIPCFAFGHSLFFHWPDWTYLVLPLGGDFLNAHKAGLSGFFHCYYK